MAVNMKLLVAQTVGLFVVFALALFVPAGTVIWLGGWVFLALFFSFFISTNVWLYHHNPGLLQERLQFSAANQKGWDRVVFPLLMIFPFAWLMFISFDAVRFHLSPVSIWVQIIGAVVLIASFYIFFLTFRENSYLSTVVRIQEERGHSVVSTGPYHFVRHPMYTGIVMFMVGTPLMLGAWYGVVVGLLLVILLMRRAVLEERTLRDELRGYADYMAQVKYRFVPYVW
jgi:protein-S-isoprenylcysteine O-methyltransferase Ste14